MKTRAVLRLLACWLLAAACASTPSGSANEPEIRIVQLPASEFVAELHGAVSIAYQLTVRNRMSETITLRQVEMQTLDRSPYALRNTPATFDEIIEPGKEAVVIFEMWAEPRPGKAAKVNTVWIQGTAEFESSKGGRFRTAFTRYFLEPKRGG